jgi:hypothetical protein
VRKEEKDIGSRSNKHNEKREWEEVRKEERDIGSRSDK